MAEKLDVVLNIAIGKVTGASNIADEIDRAMAKGGAQKAAAGAGTPDIDRIFTAQSTAMLMTYAKIEEPLNKAFAGLARQLTSGIKGGGDIAAVLQLVLGEALDQIVSLLRDIVKIILIFSGIGIPLKVMADTISAFWRGFQTVGKVWDMMLTSISKMVEPFANLLIPLMLPFLYLFTSIGRILNIMLLPLFTIMMKAFSQMGQGIASATTQMLAGDVTGAITTILSSFGKALDTVQAEIATALTPAFKLLTSWVRGFLTLDTNAIRDTLENLLGKDLGGVVATLIEVMHKGASAFAGFIAQLVGAETFNQVFGKGAFENLKTTNEGFKTGADIAATLQGVWTMITGFYDALTKAPPEERWNAVTDLIDDVKKALDSILPGFEPSFGTLFSGAFNSLLGIINKAKEYFTTVTTALFGEDGKSGLWGDVQKTIPRLNDALNKLAGTIELLIPDVANMLQRAFNLAATMLMPPPSPPTPHGDFIFRPGQPAVAFSPQDTLVGFKEGGGPPGGGSVTNNFYITGNGDSFLENTIKQVIEAEAARNSRTGYYQKGW